MNRYLHYEKAYVDGELDPAFDRLNTWDLRFVVDGNEPDWTLTWGREMLRNFRPDHIYNPNYGWRYVNAVATEVRYGSGDVKYDQSLKVSANGGDVVVMTMPYTCGSWKECDPVTLSLSQGENTLQLYRDTPPQYGVAIKSFSLKAVR